MKTNGSESAGCESVSVLAPVDGHPPTQGTALNVTTVHSVKSALSCPPDDLRRSSPREMADPRRFANEARHGHFFGDPTSGRTIIILRPHTCCMNLVWRGCAVYVGLGGREGGRRGRRSVLGGPQLCPPTTTQQQPTQNDVATKQAQPHNGSLRITEVRTSQTRQTT